MQMPGREYDTDKAVEKARDLLGCMTDSREWDVMLAIVAYSDGTGETSGSKILSDVKCRDIHVAATAFSRMWVNIAECQKGIADSIRRSLGDKEADEFLASVTAQINEKYPNLDNLSQYTLVKKISDEEP